MDPLREEPRFRVIERALKFPNRVLTSVSARAGAAAWKLLGVLHLLAAGAPMRLIHRHLVCQLI
jgi:hypothetical protein